MKKTLSAGLALVLLGGLCSGDARSDKKKFELSLAAGYGRSSFKGTSAYSDEWSYILLSSVTERTTIAAKTESAPGAGALMSYFIIPCFGVQLGGIFFNPKVTTTADFAFDWRWIDGRTGSAAYQWESDGKLRSVPLILNVIGKYRWGLLEVFGTAGGALYLNNFEARTFAGLGITGLWTVWPFITQRVDANQVPLEVGKTSWTSLGYNAGLGLDIRLSAGVALTLEGRYFFNPKKEFEWTWVPGTYDGLLDPTSFNDIVWTAQDFEDLTLTDKTTTLTVNPSFFSLLAGIKIIL